MSATTVINSVHAANKLRVLLLCSFTGIFAGICSTLLSVVFSQVAQELSPGASSGEIAKFAAYIVAAFLSGWAIGGLAFGIISDRYGRVKAMTMAIFLFSAAMLLTASSTDLVQLACWRFVAGLGVGGAMLNVSVFLAESQLASSRAAALGIFVATFQGGVLLSGILAQACPTWRLAFALSSASLSIACLAGVYLAEPSAPRSASTASWSQSGGNRKKLCYGVALFGCLLIGYWASLSWIPTWIQSLQDASTHGGEKNIATIIHGIGAIAGCIAVCMWVDSLGVRKMIAFALAGAGGLSLLMFLGHTAFSPLIYAEFGALGVCIGIAQAACYIYLPTLFPASIRGTSVGICLNGGRVITLLALFFAGSLVSILGSIAAVSSCFALLYIVGAAVACISPD